ncbi:serine/threonine-protein kinase [Leptolyngbya sp. FACHB-261]|uniref:serine/threonine-protein kinase n=1 Tax=Leptolyngbya sp. FACHB-261 TaxID=2692806 RepID=UPI001681C320|nr:serine/threonine-protein kinase [Leptolyngbya sp. FACHB-261]MBD2103500.1 protein kinase [Leptolyngbya sp. FACHB-261]
MMTKSSSPPRQDPYLGSSLANRYRLKHLIGRGAMGRVYAAEDGLLGDVPVAVKLLAHAALDDVSRARFEREAMACAQLSQRSLNIVRVMDYGITAQDVPFYVMELLTGESLRDLTAAQPLPLARFFNLARQICLGLSHAHEGILVDGQLQPIIHRDLKPSNILVVRNDGLGELVKILDFGIAKFLTDKSTNLQTQSYIGTLAYSAPEQMESEELSVQSDLYSLGVIFYTMLSGRMPFRVKTHSFAGWYRAHCQQPPRSFASLKNKVVVPAALEALVMRCLAKVPGDRPRSAAEVYEALLDCERFCTPPQEVGQLTGWQTQRDRRPDNLAEDSADWLAQPFAPSTVSLNPFTVRQGEADEEIDDGSDSLPGNLHSTPLLSQMTGERYDAQDSSASPSFSSRPHSRGDSDSTLISEISHPSLSSYPRRPQVDDSVAPAPYAQTLSDQGRDGLRWGLRQVTYLRPRLWHLWQQLPEPVRLRAVPSAVVVGVSLVALAVGRALNPNTPLVERLAADPLILNPSLPTTTQPASQPAHAALFLPLLEPSPAALAQSPATPAAPPLPTQSQNLSPYILARLAQDDLASATTACQMQISLGGTVNPSVKAGILAAQSCQSYLQWRSGDAGQAQTTASTLIATDPRQPVPYLYRGLAQASLEQWQQAQADFSQVIALKPGYGPAYQGRALALLRQGLVDQALADCQKAVQFAPQMTSAYNTCGNIKVAKGNLVGAVADYSAAIGRDSRQSVFLVNRGLTYLRQQNFPLAMADLERALALSPDGDVAAAAYYGRAQGKLAQQDFAGARSDLEQAQTSLSLQEGVLASKIAEMLEMLDQF